MVLLMQDNCAITVGCSQAKKRKLSPTHQLMDWFMMSRHIISCPFKCSLFSLKSGLLSHFALGTHNLGLLFYIDECVVKSLNNGL